MFCESPLVIRLSAASDDGLMVCREDGVGVGVGSRMVVDGGRGRDRERLRFLSCHAGAFRGYLRCTSVVADGAMVSAVTAPRVCAQWYHIINVRFVLPICTT